MVVNAASSGNYMCMRGRPIAVGMVGSNVGGAGSVKGLHLNEGEGPGAVKALEGEVRDVGKASTLSLHEGLHAMIRARPTIPTHTIMAKDSRACAA